MAMPMHSPHTTAAKYKVGHLVIVVGPRLYDRTVLIACPELHISTTVPERALSAIAYPPVYAYAGEGWGRALTDPTIERLKQASDDPSFFDKVVAVTAAHKALNAKGSF